MRAWREESDVAALVVVRGSDAAGWVNLKHVHPPDTRWVWMWVRYAAKYRAPFDVMYETDMGALRDIHRQARGA